MILLNSDLNILSGEDERVKLCKSSAMKEVLKKMTKRHQKGQTEEGMILRQATMPIQEKLRDQTLYAYKMAFERIDELFQICNINCDDFNYAGDIETEMVY